MRPAAVGPLLALVALAVLSTLVLVVGPAASGHAAPPPDVDQPPSRSRVLPASCVRGDDTMPTRPTTCRVLDRGPRSPLVVAWGDSHLWQQLPAVQAAARRRHASLVVFTLGACPPVLTGRHDLCSQNGRKALAFIHRAERRGRDVRVLLGAFWHLYLDRAGRDRMSDAGSDDGARGERFLRRRARLFASGAPRAFARLGRLGVPVAAVGQVPWVPDDAPSCTEASDAGSDGSYACDLPRTTAIADEARTDEWLVDQLARTTSPRFIDVTRYLCDEQVCRGRIGGEAVYADVWHLQTAVTRRFAAAYLDLVRR